MIILRKLGRPQVCNVILSDPLTGIVDGVNQIFYTLYDYTPGRIEIVYNNHILTSPEDFQETGPREITFTNLTPTDISLFRVTYETGDIRVVGPSTTLSSFLGLDDTPTTYSGFNNSYLRVNSDGNAIEFVSPTEGIREGITNVLSGISSTSISFDSQLSTDEYIVAVNLENKLDGNPSVYPTLVKDKTVSGFTVDFSGETDSDNYYLNWRATLPGYGSFTGGGSGTTKLSEDYSPKLSGDLDVGGHLVMLDAVPSGISMHGYETGYSGEASEMYVSDNPTGFACPLYMQPNGNWAAACAASGIYHMPCTALALEEGDGGVKKIFWKGNIKKGSWNWVPGSKIYISTVEGAITDVKPGVDSWKQVIGMAITSNTIRFDPDLSSENPIS